MTRPAKSRKRPPAPPLVIPRGLGAHFKGGGCASRHPKGLVAHDGTFRMISLHSTGRSILNRIG